MRWFFFHIHIYITYQSSFFPPLDLSPFCLMLLRKDGLASHPTCISCWVPMLPWVLHGWIRLRWFFFSFVLQWNRTWEPMLTIIKKKKKIRKKDKKKNFLQWSITLFIYFFILPKKNYLLFVTIRHINSHNKYTTRPNSYALRYIVYITK